MSFYSIQPSLNNRIMGHYPQVKDVIYHCDVYKEPLFIDRFSFEQITITPIVANPVLHSKSNLTDLIHLWNIGFSYVKLISGKLKKILEQHRSSGLQFIQCSLFQNGIEYTDYWLLNIYEFNQELIDFNKSNVSVRVRKSEGGTELKSINIENLDEFLNIVAYHNKKMEIVNLENIYFNDNIKTDLFFLKNDIKYIVSEKLKQEIEHAGCTGIEFQPTELSTIEWTAPGGEREKIYGKL